MAEDTRRFDVMGVLDATGKTIKTSVITVTAVAALIPTENLKNRKALSIRNWSDTETVYIGTDSVTVVTGYPILPKEPFPLDLGSGSNVYAICDTGQTAEVRIIEVDNG